MNRLESVCLCTLKEIIIYLVDMVKRDKKGANADDVNSLLIETTVIGLSTIWKRFSLQEISKDSNKAMLKVWCDVINFVTSIPNSESTMHALLAEVVTSDFKFDSYRVFAV